MKKKRFRSALSQLEDFYRSLLQDILNIDLTDDQWILASLPVSLGGVGVRSPVHLARVSYASSLSSTADLCRTIAPPSCHPKLREHLEAEESYFLSLNIEPATLKSQKAADRLICEQRRDTVVRALQTPREQAIFKAAADPLSGKWLQALPSPALGTTLDPNSFRVAAALRLGAPLCSPHRCGGCPDPVDKFADHHLSCERSQGRHPRHSELNAVILQSLRRAHVPAILEPIGLTMSDGRRPDGQTLTTWARGKCLIWDATVSCSVAPSHVRKTSRHAAAAAKEAEGVKIRRYRDLQQQYVVYPVAMETSGVAGPMTMEFVNEIGRRMTEATGDRRETEYLWQRLSIAVQRGNAIAVQLGVKLASESTFQ